MSFGLLKRAIIRTKNIQSFAPYERFLQTISEQGDTWMVSQGTYILWWQKRASSKFEIAISGGMCHITTGLNEAVIEKYPNEFFVSPNLVVPCPDSNFEGQLLLTIDQDLNHKELFKEVLRQEGMLNFTEGSEGEFFFSNEAAPILKEMSLYMKQGQMGRFHQAVLKIRQLISDRLAQKGLPLVRVWYHPRVNNKLIKTVVSARYDVDRAITNMPKIWDLEHNYQASSTAHLRPFGPFYSRAKIKKIIQHPTCPEIALHGEFVGHAARFGGVLP